MSQVVKVLFVIVLLSSLEGCATAQLVGHGIVIRSDKIKKIEHAQTTDVGAVTGGAVGAAAGASVGVIVTAATFGLAAPSIPALTLGGGAGGALLGGGAGYIYGVEKNGNYLVNYVVKTDTPINNASRLSIKQYVRTPISVGSYVNIMKKRNLYFIEKPLNQ